ncbi:MAG: PAS domain S-box protein, partial [Proteobacteria bacterium]
MLRQSQQRYKLMVDNVTDYAILSLDTVGRITTWNNGARQLKGYSAEEIIGTHFSKFYPEEDLLAKKPERELREATANGRFEDEGWRIRKDGSR